MLCVTHFDMFYSIMLMCSSLFHATKNSAQISLKLFQQSIMVATQSWKCTGEGSSGPGFMILWGAGVSYVLPKFLGITGGGNFLL